MTKNQFLTDANAYLKFIRGNYAESTFDEKSRKMRYYADMLYRLCQEGSVSSCNPRTMTKEDINAFVMYRRSCGIEDSTICKDLGHIGDLLFFVKNNAMAEYKASYGNKKPSAYNGKLEPLPNDTIDKVYDLARSTDDWVTLEGCMAIILGCAAGLCPQEARMLYASDVHYDDPRPTIDVRHVKGEGSWGRRRRVPLLDNVGDIFAKYMDMRQRRLEEHGIESDAFFPPLRGDEEFVTQQSMSRFKAAVSKQIGEDFVLKDGRRAYGQRLLDKGVPIEFVSCSMGHSTVATTQKYYANYRDSFVNSKIFDMIGQ